MPKYIVDGKPVELELDPDFVAVEFEPVRRSTMASAVASSDAVGDYRDRIDVPEFGITLVPTAPRADSTTRSANAVRNMSDSDSVSRAAAVFRRGTTRIIPTGRVILQFVDDIDKTKREQILADYNLNTVEESRYGELTLELDNPGANLFQISEQLSGLPEVKFAEPDLITVTPRRTLRALPPRDMGRAWDAGPARAKTQPAPMAAGPDTLSGKQYYLNLLQAETANAEAQPGPGIVVSVLDEGVDTTHADLGGVIGSYDGTDDDAFQEPKANDAHGTACAGIVGATANNALGIRGVAAGCSMLGVRIAYSDNTGENWVTTNNWIARSIDWSWEQGADVLSNSWGGGSPSNLIINAFDRARSRGRGGLGSVIVIAAGNDNRPVDFPGNLDNVLTVAASNQDDEPKTKTSSDGESWWGSNYGPEVDVAAPGVNIATTDITGDRGYNRSGSFDDYVFNFNGTSSACPQAAAVCALVISRDPSLTEAEVREILRESADKVGSVIYDPTTGHNPRMGQGRVNALEAVRRVLPVNENTEFDRFPDLAIPDADNTGISDGVEVIVGGLVTDIEVEVDITHTYRGDLQVWLETPDSSTVTLHEREGGGANDLKMLYTTNNTPGFANLVQTQPDATGNWVLHVSDLASRDVGRLNRWRLKLEVDAPGKQETKVVVPIDGSIPDNSLTGIQSDTEVSLVGAISELSVSIDITHTWRGDLKVSLNHGGQTVVLHDQEGGSDDNLFVTYTLDDSQLATFRGQESSGIWALLVSDNASHDIGKLARWTLKVEVE